MKRAAQLACVLVIVVAIATLLIEYIGGLQGMPLSIGGFPVATGSLLIGAIGMLSLLAIFIVSLCMGLERRAISLMALVASFCFALTFAGSTRGFQRGFRVKIRSVVSVDELRRIAMAVQETLPQEGRLPGPLKNLWNEAEHAALWQALVAKSAIEKLDPSMQIFRGSNTVELSWGGALVGHWGIVIETGGEQSAGDLALGMRTFTSAN